MTEEMLTTTQVATKLDRKPILEMKGISKVFGHVQALDKVDFELYEGEVVGLVGDNGAGKSTLVKILSGVYRADAGQILIDGAPADIRTPVDAQQCGIATVYQDLALVDVFDVPCNIYLGSEPRRANYFINYPKMLADARAVLATLRIDIPSLQVKVADMSGGQRQAVAVARALARGRRIFLMDEPTAALGVEQQAKVTEIILNLKRQGRTVVMISHNLEHVFRVVDRVIVLRHGRIVGRRNKADTTREEIVGLITGAVRGDSTE
jgi:ABC-type sugar transport system ATPase subunit